MASEFDELVEHLLYLIAVNDGLTHNDLDRSVREFYAGRYDLNSTSIAEPQAEDLLFSDEPPPVLPKIDEAFVENVWNWLCRHKDVIVNANSTEEPSSASPQAQDMTDSAPRLTATNERIWQAIAGHGVDNTRIKNAELVLLRIIAKHGAKGIVQPDLVRESGQDKRSVPKRTDALTSNGYIIKRAIIASGTRTSLLKMTRFAEQSDQYPDAAAQPGRGVIYYDQWFDQVVDMLNKNNRIIVLDDLRLGLGINQNTHETRALNRCLRRIIATGCVRRLQARVAAQEPGERSSNLNCLQMLRDATEVDRTAFSQQVSKKSKPPNRKPGIHLAPTSSAKDVDEDADGGDDDDADAVGEEVEVTIGEGGTLQTIETRASTRVPPQWRPELPITNFLFDLIESAGPTGLGTMDIHHRGLGPAWRRPIDELLIRLCDQWEISQPPHLQHLSILKDTAMRQRTHFFLYRTRAMFERAVEEGHTFWEAIQAETAKGKKKANTDHQAPKLDAWGFPILPAKLFAGNKDGTATLDVCEAYARPDARHTARSGSRITAQPSNESVVREQHTAETLPQDAAALLQQTTSTSKVGSKKRSSNSISSGIIRRSHKRAKLAQEPALDSAASYPGEADIVVQSSTPGSIPTTADEHHTRERASRATIADSDRTVEPATDIETTGSVRPSSSTESPRVLINPDGALRLKLDSLPIQKGRPKRYMIAVFKLQSLSHKPWFVDDTAQPLAPRLNRKRAVPDGENRPRRIVRRRVVNDEQDDVSSARSSVDHVDEGAVASLVEQTQQRSASHPIQLSTEVVTTHVDNGDPKPAADSERVSVQRSETGVQSASDRPSTAPLIDALLQREREAVTGKMTIEHVQGHDQSVQRKFAPAKASGAIVVKRTRVVMDIISKCGGVYPGNREIHSPMSVILKRLYGTSVDGLTVDNTIKDLIGRGKLKKVVFQFYDSQSLLVRRAILAESHISPSDPIVIELKSKIEDAHPAKYLPPLDVDSDQQNGASAVVGRNTSGQGPESLDHNRPSASGDLQNNQAHAGLQQGPRAKAESQPPVALVQRTEQGLEMAAQRRQALIAKLRSSGAEPASPKRPRVTQATVNYASDEDTDEEDVEPAQAQLMSKFQLDDYKPVFAHAHDHEVAFRSLYPRKTFVSSAPRRSFTRPGMMTYPDPVLPWYTFSSPPPHTTSTIEPDVYGMAKSRSSSLLMSPVQDWYPSSGTFATKQEVSTQVWHPPPVHYEYAHHGWANGLEQNVRRLSKPLHRLHGLSSRLPGHSFFGSSLAGLQARPVSLLPRSSLQARFPGRQPLQQVGLNGLAVLPDSTRLTAPDIGTNNKGESRYIFISDLSPYRTVASAVAEDDLEYSPASAVIRKRDRRGPRLFAENDRLANAVALYRAVLGGLDQKNNWGIIAHMLGFRYEPDFLRRRWDVVKTAREEDVRSAMNAVYEPFLEAYADGQVPAINFNDLGSTDWIAMLAWFERTVTTPGKLQDAHGHPIPQLPEDFDLAYDLIEPFTLWERSRETWFTSVVEKTRKDIAHEYVYGMKLAAEDSTTQSPGEDDSTVLRSLIRAVTITKAELYNASEAAKRIRAFDAAHVAAVSDQMLADKYLRHVNKGRQQPGRNFEIHDHTWSVFRRWPGKEREWKYLRQVAAARTRVLEALDKYDTIEFSSELADWEMVVLENMLRQGLLRISSLLPERNDDFEAPFPKLSAWGYSDYTYNAKTLDKARLRFPVVFEKAVEFDLGHGLTPGIDIPLGAAVGSKYDDGRLPFWVDIHGNLVADVWEMVLRSVLYLIVYRTGVMADAIADSHAQRLLTWEVDLVLEWLRQSGIIETCDPGVTINGFWTGGWRASEWWYCAFSADMITWDAH